MTGDHDGAAPGTGSAAQDAAARPAPPAPVNIVRLTVSRWIRAVADVPRWIWVGAAALCALIIAVIAMGGLAQAEVAPTELGAGDEARTSVFAITVLDAEFATEVESEYLEAEPGQKLLVMTTQMENLSDAPIGVGTTADRTKAGLVNTDDPILDLYGATAVDTVAIWRADGSSGQVILQPGVPSEVTLAWTVPDDAFRDGIVSLDVHEVEIRRGAVILSSGVVTWRAADLSARISVAATEAP